MVRLNWEYVCDKLMVAFAVSWDLVVVFFSKERESFIKPYFEHLFPSNMKKGATYMFRRELTTRS
jgi:hypothetical protein